MAAGLNVSNFVRVNVTLQPAAVPVRNFGVGLVLTSTDVVDVTERLRFYADLDGVAQEHGTTSAAYAAAALYFGQDPQPSVLYVGRWAQTASAGLLRGAVLSSAQQLVTNFTGIANGALRLLIDGTLRTVTGIDLSQALNLNGVANLIQTALRTSNSALAAVVVLWDGVLKRFTIASGTRGPASSVGYATAPGSGTDLGPLLHWTGVDASAPVVGVAAESLVDAIAALADKSHEWYSLQVAVDDMPGDAALVAAASLVEGLSKSHTFGVTIRNSGVLDATSETDLASQFKALGLDRTYSQYSATTPHAAMSFFGRAATVDFRQSNSTITLAYKREPLVVAERLTESQFQTLLSKNVNVFTQVENGTAIIFPGKMANGDYFDERHGLDWFQNDLETDLFNLLYTTPNKVPQTDAGMDLIKAVIKRCCLRAVNNGLIAPGLWTGPSFGKIKTGDTLQTGFYIYAPPIATQSDADRAARRSVPFQVAVKMAGAVHFIVSSVLANR